MKIKEEGQSFEQCPTGTHLARCIKIIDLGTQYGEYQGKPTKAHKVFIMWELSNELREEDSKPFICGKFYTASLHEKATLRQHLVNWRGREFTEAELRDFELATILDKGCQVTIIENHKGKNIVSGITQLPKGVSAPPAINPLVNFSLDEGEFNSEVFESLSDKIKEMIRQSPEYEMVISGHIDTEPMPEFSETDDEDNSQIPF